KPVRHLEAEIGIRVKGQTRREGVQRSEIKIVSILIGLAPVEPGPLELELARVYSGGYYAKRKMGGGLPVMALHPQRIRRGRFPGRKRPWAERPVPARTQRDV